MDLQKRKDILEGKTDEENRGLSIGKEMEDFLGSIKVTNIVEKLYFAKTDSKAIIPSKRDEDGAYDFYPLIKPKETAEGLVYEQFLEKGKVSMIDTGIASALSDEFYLNLNSERSSVAKYGLNVLAGTIDSGYRGKIKVMVIPLVKDVLISSMVKEPEIHDNLIVIPYDKAIAQATMLPVPKTDVVELTHSELLDIPSLRREGGWGSSGK